MKKLVKGLESLPWILRVLLTIFVGIYGNLLRLFRSLAANNIVGIVLAVILLCTGGLLVLWIIDIIMVIFGKKIWWID
jgi:hypothetical protein